MSNILPMPELRHIPRIIKYPRNSAQRTLTVADASVEIDRGCRGQAVVKGSDPFFPLSIKNAAGESISPGGQGKSPFSP
jgi:hypothetical protein